MDKSLIVGETSMKKLPFQTPTKLNDDITNEVIYRLPAISNFRFKCVSKQWFSINTEALNHKSQTLAMSGIFYVTTGGKKARLSVNYARTQKGPKNEDSSIDETLRFLPKHLNMRIHGCCNGLLLCEGWDKNDIFTSFSDQTSCVYVCNPATRKWVKVPYDYTKRVLVIILDFDPLVSVHFNVIMIKSCCCQPHRYTFEFFSSKTEEWKVCQVTNSILSECTIGDYATSIFRGLVFCLNRENTDIMGFDMEGNCCRKIELPGKSHQKDLYFRTRIGQSSLCQSGGSLHYYYKSGSALYVWKLVDYESGSWSLRSKFWVIDPSNIRWIPGLEYNLRCIVDLEFHPEVDEILLLKVGSRIHSYNMQTTKKIELCSLPSTVRYFPYSPCYLEGFGNQIGIK